MTSTIAPWEATDLQNAIGRVLTAIVAAADDLPGVVSIPARQITSTAGVTWDCQMVYVSALTVQLGLPEPGGVDQVHGGSLSFPPGGNMAVWTVTVEAGIVRSVSAQPTVMGPAQAAPSDEKYAADLATVSSDTAVLFNGAARLGVENWQPVPQSASFLASEGGMHGVAATFTVELFPGPPLPS